MKLATAAVLFAGAALGQSFEVASVNEWKGSSCRTGHNIAGDTLTMVHATLGYAVQIAYGIPGDEAYLLIGPPWLGAPNLACADIVAKAHGPLTEARMRPMLRALLAEQYKLAIHQDKKMFSVL